MSLYGEAYTPRRKALACDNGGHTVMRCPSPIPTCYRTYAFLSQRSWVQPVQPAWLPVLRTLGMQPWFGTLLYVSVAHTVFDASGTLLGAQSKKRLRNSMTGFVAFVQQRS